MAKSSTDNRIEKQKKLALDAPRIAVLSDQPLPPEQTYRESFNLSYRLGPIYDILRHPETRTPLAMAVYGSWGTGKTTAMKWLDGLLDIWNRQGQGKDRVKVTPVWFYPWKYHTKDDVCRGLVAKVIIRSLGARDLSMRMVAKVARRFGAFLGRSFVQALLSMKRKTDTADSMAEAEVSLGLIKDVVDQCHTGSHPETGYLYEFEDSLRTWIRDALGEGERMAIFIDDLDRCMPDVALQVLEALKLYLNIEKLIFVVGVDRDVVDKLVAEHYERLGLERDKSKHYLAKMFQVEVNLDPSERQIEDFLDQQLASLSVWQEGLSDTEREIFRDRILKLAERNPREIKRLINSATMEGAGALVVSGGGEEGDGELTFQQGMQLFFVRKILGDRYTMASLVGRKLGDRFFGQWSRIVREHEADEGFPTAVQVPSALIEKIAERTGEVEEFGARAGGKPAEAEELDLSFAPGPYHALLTSKAYAGLLKLVADADLGELMRIEYPTDTAVVAAATGSALPEGLIREAVARSLGKKPEEINSEDLACVTALDLEDQDISSVAPLAALTALHGLNLGGTQVSDVGPLVALSNLQALSLSGTQVSDVGSLASLQSLQELSLSRTQVSDVRPLAGLSNLRELYLNRTQVSDVRPLAGLTSLLWLGLTRTQVSDVGPLVGLTNLQHLFLSETQVSDVTPLSGLISLRRLGLKNTQVSSEKVAALRKALPNLQILV